MNSQRNNYFLFSVDLEDVRENVVNGFTYKDRVVENTHSYLNWLDSKNAKCTFFTVGKIAERYPDLIKQIINSGHEIACHSYSHIALNQFDENSFKLDLEMNLEALFKAGAKNVVGFRAPVFSLTKNTSWAHKVLIDMGFKYSSSVLPAKSPLFGWEEFGDKPKLINTSLMEIPITLGKMGPLKFPTAGGVYFRVFPWIVLRQNIKLCFNTGSPLLSYFHPYDIDVLQERFMHDGINNSKLYNYLMYFNRQNVFNRLNKLDVFDTKIIPYIDYVNNFKHGI
jgi:polysaccharide deacetylase family protein (PEP-CTERM system associated)